MPRTKIHKNAKRNREKEDIMKEHLRQFDTEADQELSALGLRFSRPCEDFSNEWNMLKTRINKKFLGMTMHEVFTNAINSDFTNKDGTLSTGSVRRNKSKDEGYLTEDSTKTGPIYKFTSGTPGPLSSAQARSRRSRSASGYLSSAIKAKHNKIYNKVEHNARSKLRTPQPTPRAQVLSVDRAFIMPKFSCDSPPALYRWPKQGETIISMSGSPVVAQGTPDLVPNVNIPIRNGMLSLRPEKLKQIDGSMVNKIESETLQQMRQLHSNLSSILSFAEKKLKDLI